MFLYLASLPDEVNHNTKLLFMTHFILVSQALTRWKQWLVSKYLYPPEGSLVAIAYLLICPF
jgi:hypothetical protein